MRLASPQPYLLLVSCFCSKVVFDQQANLLACGFGTLLLTSRIGIRQEAWLKAVQNRLRATESTLGSIKGIKMMGLTKTLAKVIQDMRVRELSLAMSYRILQITSIIICKF